MKHQRPNFRSGVTLIEIVVVITIVGILAITVLPSFARTDEARRAAGVAEVQRVLAFARECAMSSGRPVGASVITGDHRIELVTVNAMGQPVPLPNPLGQDSAPIRLRDRFGVSIQDVSIPAPAGAGSSPSAVPAIWFDHRGRPHLRADNGNHVADSTGESEIVFTDQSRVVVTPRTGMIRIERP